MSSGIQDVLHLHSVDYYWLCLFTSTTLAMSDYGKIFLGHSKHAHTHDMTRHLHANAHSLPTRTSLQVSPVA